MVNEITDKQINGKHGDLQVLGNRTRGAVTSSGLNGATSKKLILMELGQ